MLMVRLSESLSTHLSGAWAGVAQRMGVPTCGQSVWLGFLTTWQLWGSWTSYLVAQVPKDECSSEQAGSCSTFCDPALEVTHHLFCILLVEAVTDLLIFKGRGIDQGAICRCWRDHFLLLLYSFSGCGFGFPEDVRIPPSEFTLGHLS